MKHSATTTAKTVAELAAERAAAYDARLAKARELVAAGKVFPVYGQPSLYGVVNGGNEIYLVNAETRQCTCPDFVYRNRTLHVPCKHVLAVVLYRQARERQQPQLCQRCGQPARGDYCTACARTLLYGDAA